MKELIVRAVNAKTEEIKPLIISFVYFFALLCGYYMLRPIRDEMGIAGGVRNLQWLFTATFIGMLLIVPLFGWVTSHFPRKKFIPIVYGMIIINLLVFYVLFSSNFYYVWTARAFFVWVSIINLFIVSVFWSMMTDVYTDEQAKRLFASIAAGGTTGAIVGPALTGVLVEVIGTKNLLLLSACFLAVSIACVLLISKWQITAQNVEQKLGGTVLAGIRLVLKSPYLLGICGLIFMYATTSTFLYFQQANIIAEHIKSSTVRTELFATIDASTNVLTLFFQLFITSRIIKRFGLSIALATIPLLVTLAFVGLSLAPVVFTIVLIQIIRRAGNYALMRPARETLYVVLSREEKYKAKNFIDTSVYRTGDLVSAWVYAGLTAMGFSLAGIAVMGAIISSIWTLAAYQLGLRHDKLSSEAGEN